MVERFVFESENETKELILEALDSVQKRCRARLIDKNDIHLLVDTISKTPFGYAEGDGGDVARSYNYRAEKTYLFCSWYTWRNKKEFYLRVERITAKKVPYGSMDYISIKNDKETSYATVFPKRWARLCEIKRKRLIRHLPQPPSDSIGFARKDEGGLVLAVFEGFDCWVGTPSGWIKTKINNQRRNAWLHLKDLGFPVPLRKNKRLWNDEMDAYAKAYAIINKI